MDKGEAEAISLAKELDADWLLIDERKGTAVAKSIGLQTIGVLSVLLTAKRTGHVQKVMPLVHELIEKAGFWLSKDVLVKIAVEANELEVIAFFSKPPFALQGRRIPTIHLLSAKGGYRHPQAKTHFGDWRERDKETAIIL